MGWNLYAPAKSGKTTLAKKLLVSDIRDRFLLNAIFGDDGTVECSKFNHQSQNSRYISFSNNEFWYLPDNQQEITKISSIDDLYILTDGIKSNITKLTLAQYNSYHNSGSFITKIDQGYVDSRLTEGVELPQASGEDYFLVIDDSYHLIVKVQIINKHTLWIVESSFSIDTLVLHPSIKGFAYVQTEGLSAVPLEYVYPSGKSKITNKIDHAAEFAELIETLSEDAASHFSEIFQGISNGIITTRTQVTDSFNIIEYDSEEEKKNLESTVKQIKKICLQYLDYTIATQSQIDVRTIVKDKRVISGISFVSSKPLIVNKPIMSFQLSLEGFVALDSLLNYVFSPGSSYLEKGVNSDIITSLAKSTFSTMILLYAPLGSNDPLSHYDVEAVQSGEISVTTKGEWLDLPIFVSHRSTGRSMNHILATKSHNGSITLLIGGFTQDSKVLKVVKQEDLTISDLKIGKRKDFVSIDNLTNDEILLEEETSIVKEDKNERI